MKARLTFGEISHSPRSMWRFRLSSFGYIVTALESTWSPVIDH